MNNSKSILLIEDDEDDQSLFKEALMEVKNATLYDVANNGKEALNKLEKSPAPPDLIFMDINMPVMGGIECLSIIMKNPKTKHIPVIILSTATEKKELLTKLGAKAFLEKPSDYKILKKHIELMANMEFTTDSDIATVQPTSGSTWKSISDEHNKCLCQGRALIEIRYCTSPDVTNVEGVYC